MDTLCESSVKVGFLGASYFFGVVTGLLFAWPCADLYGKKMVFCASLLVSIVGQSCLIFMAYYTLLGMLFMYFVGLSWAGKTIIGISYIMDFYPPRMQPLRIFILDLFDYPSLLLISVCYQYLDRDWYYQ